MEKRDTAPKARRGMITFVVGIFIIALMVAAIYIVGLTPGERS